MQCFLLCRPRLQHGHDRVMSRHTPRDSWGLQELIRKSKNLETTDVNCKISNVYGTRIFVKLCKTTIKLLLLNW